MCSVSRPADLQCRSPPAAHIFHVHNPSRMLAPGDDEGGWGLSGRIQPEAWCQSWMNFNSTPYGFSAFGAMRGRDGVTDETSPWRPHESHRRSSRFGAEPISPAIKQRWAVQKTPWRFEIWQITPLQMLRVPLLYKQRWKKSYFKIYSSTKWQMTMNSWLKSDSVHNKISEIYTKCNCNLVIVGFLMWL